MLSVVIATWNSGHTIERCLASLLPYLQQIEQIVIVDNSSSDDTVAQARRLVPAKKLDCISESDAGIYDAFNKGVRRASGDSIYFLGSDDYVLPGFGKMLGDPRLGQRVLVAAVRQNSTVIRHSRFLPGITLLYRNIPHQGMFIPKAILLQRPYDVRYSVLADYAWNLCHYWSSPEGYAFRPELCCEWSIGGVSSRRPDPLFSKDKSGLIEQHAPIAVRLMYGIFKALKERSK